MSEESKSDQIRKAIIIDHTKPKEDAFWYGECTICGAKGYVVEHGFPSFVKKIPRRFLRHYKRCTLNKFLTITGDLQ